MEMHLEMSISVVSVRLSSSLEMWDCREKGAACGKKGVSGGTQPCHCESNKSESYSAYLYKLFLLGIPSISPILPEGATATEM